MKFKLKTIDLIPRLDLFFNTSKLLKKSQYYNNKTIKYFQLEKLRKLIHHSYNNVPYYRKLFNYECIVPSEINSLSDLKKIPFLSRKDVFENIIHLKAINFKNNKFHKVFSSGATGKPLEVYIDKKTTFSIGMAYLNFILHEGDCNIRNKFVSIFHSEKIYNYELFGRILCLSPKILTDKILDKFVCKIKKFKPKFIMGYPSALYFISKYMYENKIECMDTIKAIFCSGEVLYEWERELIESTFDRKVFSFYSHEERVAYGFSCKKSNYYHMFPQYGIIELIDKNGIPVLKENQAGEIVATGFINKLFPLIRYKTGDIGIFTKKKCNCGRNYFFIKDIVGKTRDFLVSRSNFLYPLSGLFDTLNPNFLNIREFQIFQNMPGKIVIRISKKKFNSYDEERLVRIRLSQEYGNEFDFKIDYVNQIPRMISNKFPWFIQKLKISEWSDF
jgi:phenylacetate-coenzyme A ligase PaaK-like adenylate-forming protein